MIHERNPDWIQKGTGGPEPASPGSSRTRGRPRRRRVRAGRAAILTLLVLGIAAGCRKRESGGEDPDVFTVVRGPLDITVTESGTVDAEKSVTIKNKVSRTVRILEMVDEGTIITEEDVKKGLVLVRFDSTDLETEYANRQASFESAKAALTQAKEALAIQESENASNIRSAEMNLTFAMNDFKKLVGQELAERYREKKPDDLRAVLDDPKLGGQALQDLRSLQSDIELEREELSRAETQLKWTEKLFEKGYVTANDLQADRLALKRRQLSLQTAEEKLKLYRMYDFPKNFEKQWAAVLEARERLERAKATARSKMAQAQAVYNSRLASFKFESSRLEKLKRDIEACTIRATQPGLVVAIQPPRWRGQGPLKPGDDVRPFQSIFRLPDISRMITKVNIHEAVIDLIEEGQKATVTVDAVPGKTFHGKVVFKALVPSSQNSWLNPDLKVYEVHILIDGQNKTLRPGMTATAEILVDHLEDVLYIPIQAVQTDADGKHYVYLADSGRRVPVRLGKRNQIFVVVEEGLKEGDRVLLIPPELKS